MTEARLEDGVPVTAGWFVLNARDAPWLYNDLRGDPSRNTEFQVARMDGEQDIRRALEQIDEKPHWLLIHIAA